MTTPKPNLLIKALDTFVFALVLLWVLAFLGLAARAPLFHQPFQLSRLFLGNLGHPLDDFTLYDTKLGRFPPSSGLPPIVYPAPLMSVYLLFGLLGTHAFAAYEFCVVVFPIIAAIWLAIRLNRLVPQRAALICGYLLVSLLLCFPFWFEIERGNLEAVVWVVQILAVSLLLKKRYVAAGVLIALGACMKIYPGLLFLLLVSRKQYKALAISLLTIIPMQLIGLSILGPSITEAYREMVSGLRVVAETHVFNYLTPDIGFDHSLFSLGKQALRMRGLRLHYFPDPRATLLSWSAPYLLIAACTILGLYWYRIRHLSMVNQVVALILLSTIFPPMALEYTLIQVTIVWAVCLICFASQNDSRDSMPVWALNALMFCFAFIFSPGSYLGGSTVGIAGQFKLAALIFSVYLVCRFPLAEPLNSRSLPQTQGFHNS